MITSNDCLMVYGCGACRCGASEIKNAASYIADVKEHAGNNEALQPGVAEF